MRGEDQSGRLDEPAKLHETHISWIFMLGDRVYKLKKPVATSFLDFSTTEARKRACLREVELNRRISPDVYLEVLDVVDPAGRACDHLVVMRRMPEDRRLSMLLSTGDDVERCLRRVVEVVAAFHARAETSQQISEAGSRDALKSRWDDNLREMSPFVGRLIPPGTHASIEHLAHRYLEGRESLFTRRVEKGKVRDAHGDLLADDIYCLDDGPRILDCIEFDDRLRHVDVLDDIAFLAMDLERLGAAELAAGMLNHYRELSEDDSPDTLAHHYIAYRAHVRAKVACLRHEQGDVGALDQAELLLRMAADHLAAGRVFLVLVGGLPGAGKSTLSKGISDALGWRVLRSDEVRRENASQPGESAGPSGYKQGLYAPEVTAATYRALLERAQEFLQAGVPVVIDASWTDAQWRRMAAEVARSTASDLIELSCEVGREEAHRRIARRTQQGGDPSDATAEVADRMATEADPWPAASRIDTSSSPEAALHQALKVIEVARRAS
jgi:uncharacterized protein